MIRAARLLPAACRAPISPVLGAGCAPLGEKLAPVGLGAQMVTRNAGVGVLSAGIAVNGVGLCALGLGILFHGLVSGIARNPALKEDLMVYAMIGVGMVEFFAIVILLLSGLLLYTKCPVAAHSV